MHIVLEMANNHNGDVVRGCKIIEAFAPLVEEFPHFKFSTKFQYRDPGILRDGADTAMCRRIRDTMLSEAHRQELLYAAHDHGFFTGCTPFDEPSAAMVKVHGYDFAKVASCSINDWPLLEAVAALGMPVIASTAGASQSEVKRAAEFLTRRVPSLVMMHCVALYPTQPRQLRMDRVDMLQELGCLTGFSTHEDPNNSVGCRIAVAKGCRTLEWHVSLPPLNSYSLTVDQARTRLWAVAESLHACDSGADGGDERETLGTLERGAYAARPLVRGEKVTLADVKLQIPSAPGQLMASDFGKYSKVMAVRDAKVGEPILDANLTCNRAIVQQHADAVLAVLRRSGTVFPRPAKLTLSHHNGLSNFAKTGCAMIEVVNGEKYAKKLIIVLPGQQHPAHKHARKTETFHVLWGELQIGIETGQWQIVPMNLPPGGLVTVHPRVWHGFRPGIDGCVFEEISTALDGSDSEYMDPVEAERKTTVWVP